MLRLVGGHVGPVLRTGPPVDSAAEAIEWTGDMQQAAAQDAQQAASRRRRGGRFVREPDEPKSSSRDVLKH